MAAEIYRQRGDRIIHREAAYYTGRVIILFARRTTAFRIKEHFAYYVCTYVLYSKPIQYLI